MPGAWPTPTELEAQLARVGVESPGATLLQVYLNSAVAAFEHLSGWNPFLASGSAVARLFDPPVLPISGRWLLALGAGAVSITSVQTFWDAVASTGTTVAANTGYVPRAYGEGSGQPYTEIEFLAMFGSNPKSIRIVADWGYASTVPDDAWLAVLRGASQAIASESGNLSRIKQGPVEMEFAASSSADTWADEIRAVASRYRLIQL